MKKAKHILRQNVAKIVLDINMRMLFKTCLNGCVSRAQQVPECVSSRIIGLLVVTSKLA